MCPALIPLYAGWAVQARQAVPELWWVASQLRLGGDGRPLPRLLLPAGRRRHGRARPHCGNRDTPQNRKYEKFDCSATIPQSRDIVYKLQHPAYDSSTLKNDIALFKLSAPVDPTVYTPVCLPPAGTEYQGKQL